MIKMLRAVMEKVESIQEQMGTISRETEILRIKKKHQSSKSLQQKGKMLFLVSVDWAQLKRQSLNFRVCQ